MSFTEEQENPFETAQDWDVPLEKILDEGNYVCRITEVEDETAKSSGKPKLIVKFLEVHGQGTITAWLPYNCDFLRKVATLYRAAKIKLPSRDEFDPSDYCRIKRPAQDRLVGATVGVLVREDKSSIDQETGLPKVFIEAAGFVDASRISSELGTDTTGLPDTNVGQASETQPKADLMF